MRHFARNRDTTRHVARGISSNLRLAALHAHAHECKQLSYRTIKCTAQWRNGWAGKVGRWAPLFDAGAKKVEGKPQKP